jgi:cytochrome P450
MANRAIIHDKDRYPDYDAFKPTRFLTAEGALSNGIPDPIQGFGCGRRICPGRHFAQDVQFMVVSNILAAFKIEKPVDEMGNVVEPKIEFSQGALRYILSKHILPVSSNHN